MVAAIKHTIVNAVLGIAEAAVADTEEPTAVDKGCTTTAADIKFTVVRNLEQVALASAIIMVDYITIIAQADYYRPSSCFNYMAVVIRTAMVNDTFVVSCCSSYNLTCGCSFVG